MKTKSTLLLLSVAMLSTGLAKATTEPYQIPIFLKPSQTSKPIGYLSPQDPTIKSASPVRTSDGQVWYRGKWNWDEYASMSNGFVHKSYVDYTGKIKAGAPVYLRQDASSSLLTTIKADDTVKTADMGNWIAVEVDKSTTVFFQKNKPKPMAAAKNPMPEPQQPQPAATAPKPAPTTIAKSKPMPIVPPGGASRRFEGILKLYASFLGPHPQYKYVLTDHDGQNLAFLDTKDLFLDRPIERFYNEPVVIQGDVIPNEGHRHEAVPLIIEAKTLYYQ